MKLVLTGEGSKDDNFINYLIDFLKNEGKERLKTDIAIKRFDPIFKEIDGLKNIKDTKTFIIKSFDYLIAVETYYSKDIKFNEIRKFPNTTFKVIDIIKFINYGNLDYKASNFYTDLFNDIEENIKDIYTQFLLEQSDQKTDN